MAIWHALMLFFIHFIHLLGFTAQRLLKDINRKTYLKKMREGEKKQTIIAPRQPQTCSHPIYTQMLTEICQAIRMFSLNHIHNLPW